MTVRKIYRKHLPALILGPTLKIIEAFFDLLIPLFMKAIIDLQNYQIVDDIPNKLTAYIAKFIRNMGTWVNNNPALNDALIGGTFILIMGVVGFLITMVCQFIASVTCVKVGTELRDSLFAHIMSLSKVERERIGNERLLTIINNDTYQVQQFVLIYIRLILRAPIIIVGALIFSFILNVNIGFVFLAITPIILTIIFFVMSKSSFKYTKIQEEVDHISNNVTDTLVGNKVIHAFDKRIDEANKFKTLNDNYKNKAVNAIRITSLVNPLTFCVISLAMILVVSLGGTPMFNNPDASAFASTVMAEVQYLGQILFTLVQLSNVVLIFTKANVSTKRIDSLFSVSPSIRNNPNGIIKSIRDNETLFLFKDVSFKYFEDGNNAIKNINLEIKKGQSIGFIGGIGSGKSTLLSLFNRLNDRSEGAILYKGVDIKDYQLDELRKEVGVVSQKAVLFNGSIKSNLLIGNVNASKEMMDNALKISEAYDFVYNYPDGLDHIVNDNGKNYSGGQRQRLSIARTLLLNREVLILDDVTSALDLLTEKRVKDNISNAYQGITKIIVSQRISSLLDCDVIYLFNNGEIVASGSHDELLNTSSIYKEIYESQIAKGGE